MKNTNNEEKTSQSVVGKEIVESGENKIAESIIQGTTTAWGKLTEFIVGEKKKK